MPQNNIPVYDSGIKEDKPITFGGTLIDNLKSNYTSEFSDDVFEPDFDCETRTILLSDLNKIFENTEEVLRHDLDPVLREKLEIVLDIIEPLL